MGEYQMCIRDRDKDRFIENGDIILVKGSRGMKMEQVVENILKQ